MLEKMILFFFCSNEYGKRPTLALVEDAHCLGCFHFSCSGLSDVFSTELQLCPCYCANKYTRLCALSSDGIVASQRNIFMPYLLLNLG